MEIDLEILIQKITRQVINELESRGVRVASATPPAECRSGQGVEQARS